MVVVCIRAFADSKPGDEVTVPDGSEVSPFFFVPKDDKPPAVKPVKPIGSTE